MLSYGLYVMICYLVLLYCICSVILVSIIYVIVRYISSPCLDKYVIYYVYIFVYLTNILSYRL
uniref:Uncharacterized protein n=1 Tax=Octopus bimaculoides TaxID=37653 RepID=A0A0L8IB92_OCTBM